MSKPEQIHMIAICGTGMAALAGLLKKAGHHVSGSDQAIYPPMSTLLQQDHIICKQGFSPLHLAPETDRVIIGNAVSKDNPEVIETLKRKLPYLSMSSALEQYFLQDKCSLVVTGTHGKTTTASLLASVLASAGKDPGALIGGWIKNFDSNHRIGTGPYFVVEGDEYDTAFFDKGPKFLHYRPSHAILTSIEFDHADIFNDLSEILVAFKKFVRLIPKDGRLLIANGSPEIDEVIQGLPCHIERYGIETDEPSNGVSADWQAVSIEQKEDLITFDVLYQEKIWGRIKSPLLGHHNLRNTLAVIALCHHLKLSQDEIQKGLLSFQGIKRRQEIVGKVNDILIIDDFAHHPTAIRETLSALNLRYPSRRLWAIFEPRSATSRRKIFQDAFIQAFQKADQIIFADLYAPEKIVAEDRLDPRKIVSTLNQLGKPSYFLPTTDQILEKLVEKLCAGDLVCIMSSGSFDDLHRKLLSRLKETRSENTAT